MLNYRQINQQKGLSLVEIIIAIAILSILTLACISMFIRSRNLSHYTHERQIVYKAIQARLEQALDLNNAKDACGAGGKKEGFKINGLQFAVGKLFFDADGNEVANGTHEGRIIIKETDGVGNPLNPPSGSAKMMKITIEVKIYHKNGTKYIEERITTWREWM